jgi:hypothetical protein
MRLAPPLCCVRFIRGRPHPGQVLVEVESVKDKPPGDAPVAGMYREDMLRINEVLAGVRWPAQKWQLIAHVEHDPARRARTDARTICQLWALPTGWYSNLGQVLSGAARTARGHPNRLGAQPLPHRPTSPVR